MSMSEPLLPHPADPDRTAATEPGPGGPAPAPEEPDILHRNPAEGGEAHADLPAQTPFRTPTAGERLHPDDLADDGNSAPGGSPG